MAGVKVVEVAQFTFTPAAGAVLADWGAEVIKVEHAVHGDAQRGLRIGTGGASAGSFQPLMEHPNRSKRSIGLALEVASGRDVLLELVSDADVFITNFLPSARQKLRIDVDDIRTANPSIVYVRGSGHGQRGAEAERPGYDGSTFWSRMGMAWASTPPDSGRLLGQPAGAFGDSMGGAMMAGGIAAALFDRLRTGEGSIVDVSLMGVGAWAMALTLGTAMVTGVAQPAAPLTAPPHQPFNPLIGNYRTADGRYITLMLLQPGRHFADLCRHLDLDELIQDDRFATGEGVMAHAEELGRRIAEVLASRPYTEWVERLATLEGAWSPAANPLELLDDPQLEANGCFLPVVDADGKEQRLVANPVQFDETPPLVTRGPQFAEHTDDILRELGKSEDEILQLKLGGACT
jgi:crotonobetainyl-CoA:carnitine CoA-transferase CaiB-like acyl-CoA transferase